MASLNHVHTYVQYKKRPGYWRCADAHCTHVLDSEAVRGKATLCTQCGKEMILNYEDMRRKKPRCVECSETKEAMAFRRARALIEGFQKSIEEHPKELDNDKYEEKA